MKPPWISEKLCISSAIIHILNPPKNEKSTRMIETAPCFFLIQNTITHAQRTKWRQAKETPQPCMIEIFDKFYRPLSFISSSHLHFVMQQPQMRQMSKKAYLVCNILAFWKIKISGGKNIHAIAPPKLLKFVNGAHNMQKNATWQNFKLLLCAKKMEVMQLAFSLLSYSL